MMQGSRLIPSRVVFIQIDVAVGSVKEEHIFYTERAFGAKMWKMISPELGMGILIVKCLCQDGGTEEVYLFPLDKVTQVKFIDSIGAKKESAILVD